MVGLVESLPLGYAILGRTETWGKNGRWVISDVSWDTERWAGHHLISLSRRFASPSRQTEINIR